MAEAPGWVPRGTLAFTTLGIDLGTCVPAIPVDVRDSGGACLAALHRMKPTVLVAHDFGEPASRALAWAADLVRTTGGRLVVRHVVDLLPLASATPEPMLAMPIEAAQIRELESALRALVAIAAEGADTGVVLGAGVGATIVRLARDLHAELLVVGTHGRTGIRRLFLGSVAEHVVRHAHCPVVVVRAVELEAVEGRAAANVTRENRQGLFVGG